MTTWLWPLLPRQRKFCIQATPFLQTLQHRGPSKIPSLQCYPTQIGDSLISRHCRTTRPSRLIRAILGPLLLLHLQPLRREFIPVEQKMLHLTPKVRLRKGRRTLVFEETYLRRNGLVTLKRWKTTLRRNPSNRAYSQHRWNSKDTVTHEGY